MKPGIDGATRRGFFRLTMVATLGLCAGAAFGQPGQNPGPYTIDPRAEERSYYFEEAGMDMPYCVYASSKISENTPAPLIIGLHGDSDEPENISELSEQDVMNVLNMMLEEFNVDEDRIYLMGHSMGGGGTMYLGPKHAEIWAAIAPIAGGGGRPNQTELLQQLKEAGVAVIVSHGEADDIVPVRGSRDLAAELEAMGIESEYLELAGVGHGPIINLAQERIFRFFARHSR